MSHSSKRWVSEHRRDPYVKKSRQDHFRSRSAYKLLQLNERFHMVRAGDRVVDLGAAPGGWAQVAAQGVGPKGRVVAVDRLAMDPIQGVLLVQGDVFEPGTQERIQTALEGEKADLLLSDMAPNTSGVPSLDHDRSMELVERVLVLAPALLRPGGHLVVKVFQGPEVKRLSGQMRSFFETVKVFKPDASRSRSTEVYLVGKGFRSSG